MSGSLHRRFYLIIFFCTSYFGVVWWFCWFVAFPPDAVDSPFVSSISIGCWRVAPLQWNRSAVMR